MNRSHRMIPVAALLAVVALLAACTAKPVDLTTEDSGSSQSLKAGQEMVIRLNANPTTGYQWALDGPVPGQLTQVGKSQYKSESNLIGGGGTDTWTFKAAQKGKGTLKLKYWRSFEPTATPVAQFQVTVAVE